MRVHEEAFQSALAHLTDENAAYRWGAAEALGRMGDPRAIGPLIKALRDEDWRVRMKAAWSLGRLGDRSALGPLREARRDPAEGVQDMAKEAEEAILQSARDQ
ncbi:MAG: HEAT repeat domain-containing protein [Methanomicrobiales archaeon]|nr:HEAT repeat domain-containing protein [Methanomicrobiales archaeon]